MSRKSLLSAFATLQYIYICIYVYRSVCAQCGDVCPKLTYTQRLIGFFSCTAFGYVLSILGTLTLFGGASPDNIRTFVILYMIGNVRYLSGV